MIFILEYIYENYIVYIEDDLLIVIEKKFLEVIILLMIECSLFSWL